MFSHHSVTTICLSENTECVTVLTPFWDRVRYLVISRVRVMKRGAYDQVDCYHRLAKKER